MCHAPCPTTVGTLQDEFRVPENADVNYPVGNVQAFDPDLNPVIVYEIICKGIMFLFYVVQ